MILSIAQKSINILIFYIFYKKVSKEYFQNLRF